MPWANGHTEIRRANRNVRIPIGLCKGWTLRGVKRLTVVLATIVLTAIGLATPAHASAGRYVSAYYSINGQTICISTGSLQTGTHVTIGYCDGPNVYWNVTYDSNNKATIHASADDTVCLDALNGTVDGPVAVWTCNGGANQKWNVAQLGNGLSMWGSTHNGTRCLTVPNSYGDEIVQTLCNQQNLRQIWTG
jgi:hypothetical protein